MAVVLARDVIRQRLLDIAVPVAAWEVKLADVARQHLDYYLKRNGFISENTWTYVWIRIYTYTHTSLSKCRP